MLMNETGKGMSVVYFTSMGSASSKVFGTVFA